MTACIPEATRATVTSELDEFLGLLCADEELLQAEFEAIVAAAWPLPPDRRAVVGRWHVGPTGGPAPSVVHVRDVQPAVDSRPGVGEWARQRSPPRLRDRRQPRPKARHPRPCRAFGPIRRW